VCYIGDVIWNGVRCLVRVDVSNMSKILEDLQVMTNTPIFPIINNHQ
jgi:hypothetical protein